MSELFISKVAVSNVIYCADKFYTYLIPKNLLKSVVPGKRVLVPFGLYNAKKQAMVYDVSPLKNDETICKLKSIIAVLDTEPLLSVEMLNLSICMKNWYFCTLYDAVKCMIPSGLNFKLEHSYILNPEHKNIKFDFDDIQKKILLYLKENGNIVSEKLLNNEFGSKLKRNIDFLIENKIILKEEKILRLANELKQKIFKINDNFNLSQESFTLKQRSVIDLLLDNDDGLSIKEIKYFTGVGETVVKNLLEKNVLKEVLVDKFRRPVKYKDSNSKDEIKLSKSQKEVYLGLREKYKKNEYDVSLLFGVTGSGKTSVFLKLIDDVIHDGKSVIMMVPEISLTPQMIDIFKARYQEKVAIFHSGLSVGERLDEFRRVKLKRANIVIGTRSAVFAPVENIGLIVMDEEHEDTYKSDSSPRYHARDIAKYRCLKNYALLLLSSATPSIESFYLAQKNKYSFFELSCRYGNVKLPDVEIVDMNEEIDNGNTYLFSNRLYHELEENFKRKRQSILLLNRRGYNTFIKCANCNEALMCPNCSVLMTYHIKNNRLTCHHCGLSMSLIDKCPKCHKKSLKYQGFGTQRIEEELKILIKDCKILRMDADTTLRKNSYSKNLEDFFNKKYDIMIGTQMVAKGLNFPNVTFVGIISIDQYLFSEDFRSDEKTFALITQVIGRSGRFEGQGRAIIQTYSPESQTIKLAAKQNYKDFYKNEILIREALLYPPFVSMSVIFFSGKSEEKVKKASSKFFNQLTKKIKKDYPYFLVKIFGPSPKIVLKVNNNYRYKIVLKYKDRKTFRFLINDLLDSINKDKSFKGISVLVDVKPNTIM